MWNTFRFLVNCLLCVDRYLPIDWVTPRPVLFPSYKGGGHLVGGVLTQLRWEAWQYELYFENDLYLSSYFARGVYWGFDIVDRFVIPSHRCDNYKSVGVEPCFQSLII